MAIQLPVATYSLRELREEIAEAEADIKTLQEAVAVFKKNYIDSKALEWLINDLTASIEADKLYLKALSQ